MTENKERGRNYVDEGISGTDWEAVNKDRRGGCAGVMHGVISLRRRHGACGAGEGNGDGHAARVGLAIA